jgi:hypothetical protein
MDKVKELIEDNWEKHKFISLSLDKNKVKVIVETTNFLNEIYTKIPLRSRAYVIKNNISKETIPKCICCDKYAALNITNPEKGFRTYCGPKCSRSNKTISKDLIKLFDDYNFLYKEKIINQKSIEQLANEYNISITPVVKYLKKYNLYQLNDARRRNIKANQVLENKETLVSLYKTNTMDDIAKSLGTTKGTISRWFDHHNIKAKPSNSYERKIKKVSNEETELYEYIKSVCNEKIYQSNRSILNGKELDIYIPDKNLAIEYNGLYSHHYRPWEDTPGLIKDSKYHLFKTLECEKKDIQLLQFYSDEWKYNTNIVKSIIISKLHLNQKVYARKCNIIEIDTLTKNKFLSEYHIQGEDKSSIKLGLEYNNKIVCVMTFAKSRFNRSYEWELTRFCVKSGLSVLGGFSKLLKSFINSYGTSIISYADRRYSNGNVYKTNGFDLIGVNKPSYYYVDKNFIRRIHRMKFQKKYIGAYDCTEYEKAREMGFEKIWDCGTLAYGFKQ